jgi:predicted RNA-binding Zn-ribbon protein involved in translation (DUF1610 family)
MAIFDEIGRKISNVGQNVVKGTKDFSDISKLNTQISDEQRQLGQLFDQLGRLFYEQFGGSKEAPFREQCDAIEATIRRIEACQAEVSRIRGIKHCPSCGIELPAMTVFCGNCGARTEPARAAPPGQYDQQPPQYAPPAQQDMQPPQYAQPPQYDQQPPQYSPPPQYDQQPPQYDQQPQYAPPPQYDQSPQYTPPQQDAPQYAPPQQDAPTPQFAADTGEARKFCVSCGFEMEADALFCPSCGQQL